MELQFVFPLAAGLHARPAGLLQEQVSRFRSAITLVNNANGAVADARSTLAPRSPRRGIPARSGSRGRMKAGPSPR